MIITFGQAKQALSKYVGKSGKCPESEEVDLFVKEVIQQLLFRGANGNLRKWVFFTQEGTFTAPADLELPVKMRIEGKVGFVYDKFYEFYEHNTLHDCQPCEHGLVEEINPYFTQYNLPEGGAHILAVPMCDEGEGANILIQGIDACGKEVHVPHKGEMMNGEHLSINKSKPKYTHTKFSRVTGIEKVKTNHYVRLYWYCPNTGKRGLLAEYKPSDTHPSFRRFRVNSIDCDECYKVTVLGRIRFCENYADNDVVPVGNLRALKLMAQQLQAEDNDDIQVASYKNQRIEQTLENENYYKRTPQAPVDFVAETSPGGIKNLI